MTHTHDPETCRALVERLSEYLDAELSPDLCRQIEGHLEDCPPCREFLESLKRTVRWLDTVKTESMPEELRRELQERLRNLPHSD